MPHDNFSKILVLEDAVSDFETAWDKGLNPKIEHWLGKYPDINPELFFRELLLVEFDLRQREKSAFESAEYLHRFPGHRDAIESLFSESAKLSIPSDQSPTVDFRGGEIDTDDFELNLDRVESADPVPKTSQQIGDFLIVEQLGRGGMGEVFRARQVTLAREVALKLIRSDIATSKREIDRFRREAKAAAGLAHPNIVPVFEHGFDGQWFIAMPILEGGTLEKPLPARSLSLNDVITIVARIADAVQYAHEQGVVHRDIKPANILFDRQRIPYLTDFGLARIQENSELTRSIETLGTPAFMSPEQASGITASIGPATDIYSLGAVLYRMLTGKPPFHGASVMDVLERIRDEQPLSMRELDPTIPRDLDTIVLKCLEKTPDNRYASAAQLASDLRRFQAHEPITARPVSRLSRIARWCKRKPFQAGLIGVMFCLAIASGVAAFAFSQSASLERQLRQKTTEQRDNAIARKDREQRLREAAESAQLDAEDASRFAELQQLGFAQKSIELALLNQQSWNAQLATGPLQNLAQHHSIDSQFYEKQTSFRRDNLFQFSCGDWALYDSAISPDGQWLAIADRSGLVQVWDFKNEKLVIQLAEGAWDPIEKRYEARWRILQGKTNVNQIPSIYSSIAWQNQNSLLATSVEGELIRFNVATGEKQILIEHSEQLNLVRYSPDLATGIVSDEAGLLQFFNESGEVTGKLEFGEDVTALEYIDQSKFWIVGGINGAVALLNNENEIAARFNSAQRVHDFAFSSLDDTLNFFVASGENPIQRLKLENDRLVHVADYDLPFRYGYQEFQSVALFDENRRLAVFDQDGWINTWEIESGALRGGTAISRKADNRYPDILESSELDDLEKRPRVFVNVTGNSQLLTVDNSSNVQVFDAHCFEPKQNWLKLNVQTGPYPQLANDRLTPDRFWSLDRSGQLSLISFSRDEIIASNPNAHSGGREELVVLANGDVVTAGGDRFIKFWRLVDGKIEEIRRFESPENMLSIAVHEEKQLAAGVDETGKIVVWELETGKIKTTLDFPGYQQRLQTLEDEIASNAVNGEEDTKLFAEMAALREIKTGKLTFSAAGEYLFAFGAGQFMQLFRTVDFQPAESIGIEIAGKGGVAVCFSPVVEHRLIATDGNGWVTGHAGDINDPSDRRIVHGNQHIYQSDFALTDDSRRIASIEQSGRVGFFSAQHFVETAVINTGFRNCCSIGIGSGNTCVGIGMSDGTFGWCLVGDTPPKNEPESETQGIVHRILKQSDKTRISWAQNRLIPDSAGNSASIFVFDRSQKERVRNEINVLRKCDGIWKTENVRFQGDEDGPIEYANLAFSNDGRAVIAFRQQLPLTGQYNGRLMLAYENPTGDWPTEIVMNSGNAGAYPHLVFEEDGSVESVLHFNWSGYSLVHSRRGNLTPNGWPLEVIRGFTGSKLSTVVDAEETIHCLSSPMKGMGDESRNTFVSIKKDGETDLSEGKGLTLHLAGGRFISYDHLSSKFYERQNGGAWNLLTTAPFRRSREQASYPFVSDNGEIWICAVRNDRIEAHHFDGERWTYKIVAVEGYVPSNRVYCRVKEDGRLEVLGIRAGSNGEIAIVESVQPIRLPEEK